MRRAIGRTAAAACLAAMLFHASPPASSKPLLDGRGLVKGELLARVAEATGEEWPWRWPSPREIKKADTVDRYPNAPRYAAERWYTTIFKPEYQPRSVPRTEFVIGRTHYARWSTSGLDIQTIQRSGSSGVVFTIPTGLESNAGKLKAIALAALDCVISRDPVDQPTQHAVSASDFEIVPFQCSRKQHPRIDADEGLIWQGCRDTMFGPLSDGTEVLAPRVFWSGRFVDDATEFLKQAGRWYLFGRGWSDDVHIWSDGKRVGLLAHRSYRGHGCKNAAECPWFDPEERAKPGSYGEFHP